MLNGPDIHARAERTKPCASGARRGQRTRSPDRADVDFEQFSRDGLRLHPAGYKADSGVCIRRSSSGGWVRLRLAPDRSFCFECGCTHTDVHGLGPMRTDWLISICVHPSHPRESTRYSSFSTSVAVACLPSSAGAAIPDAGNTSRTMCCCPSSCSGMRTSLAGAPSIISA